MRDPMSRAAAEFLPVDPFAGGTLGWHAQPEQQQAAKSKPKDDDDDDDEDDEDLDDDDDEDEDEDDDDLADLTPEELKAELKAVQGQLARSSSSNAKKRKALKAKEQELIDARKPKPAAKPKAKGDDDAEPVDLDAVRDEARREVQEKADTRIKLAAVRGELRAANVDPKRIERAVKMLDLEELDVDDDGAVEGIDDQLVKLRKDFPELFPKGTRRRPSTAGDKDRDGRETKPRKPMTTTEMQVAAALGKPIRK